MSDMNRRTLLGAIAAGGAVGALSQIPAFAQTGPIKIGLIIPLSGPLAIYGPQMKNATEIAVEYFNKAGGANGRQLEVVTRDDGGNATNTLTAFRELVGDGINIFMIGPVTSQILAVQPLLADTNSILTSVGPVGLSLTHKNFVKNYFRANNNAYAYRGYAKALSIKYPSVKKWSAIFPDIESGRDIQTWFQSGLKEFYAQTAGGPADITQSIKTKLGATDYRAQISELMSSDTEGLMLALYGADGITFLNQARSFGLDKKFKVISEMSIFMDLPKTLKANTPENVWINDQWDFASSKDNEISAFLYDQFVKRTNDAAPSWLVGRCCDAIAAYVAALNQAKSTDVPMLVAALEKLEVKSATGNFRYRAEDHQLIDATYRYAKVGPAPSNSQGWAIFDRINLPPDGIIEPPTPGANYPG